MFRFVNSSKNRSFDIKTVDIVGYSLEQSLQELQSERECA